MRAGRAVALQHWVDGAWRTLRSTRVDDRGRGAYVLASQLGSTSYRAVALPHHGAPSVSSSAVAVTAADRTAPTAPYGLTATAGDGLVDLAWSRTLPSDFSHHQVWMRTATTAWAVVGETDAATYRLVLPNDVQHWFSVTSVDTAGNRSAGTPEVSATPTAPDAAP